MTDSEVSIQWIKLQYWVQWYSIKFEANEYVLCDFSYFPMYNGINVQKQEEFKEKRYFEIMLNETLDIYLSKFNVKTEMLNDVFSRLRRCTNITITEELDNSIKSIGDHITSLESAK
jgi:hypothetical protein